MAVDESKFDYNYVPEHLKERKKNWRTLSAAERMELTWELSLAAWEKLGVVYDPSKPDAAPALPSVEDMSHHMMPDAPPQITPPPENHDETPASSPKEEIGISYKFYQ